MVTSPSIAGTSSISTIIRRKNAVLLGAARVLTSSSVNSPKRVELKHMLSTCSTTRSSAVTRASIGEMVVVDGGVVEKGKDEGKVVRVGVICGGPSAERGISLNSARSVLDHLQVHTISFNFIDSIKFSFNNLCSFLGMFLNLFSVFCVRKSVVINGNKGNKPTLS